MWPMSSTTTSAGGRRLEAAANRSPLRAAAAATHHPVHAPGASALRGDTEKPKAQQHSGLAAVLHGRQADRVDRPEVHPVKLMNPEIRDRHLAACDEGGRLSQ